ncbi:MAG: hypothetical protein AB8B86_14015 [Pseudomonadales bacterium]
MVEFYQRLAHRLNAITKLLWLLLALAAASFAWLVANATTASDDSLMLLSVVISAWLIGLLAIQSHFSYLPDTVEKHTGIVAKLMAKTRRFMSWCLALAMTLCTIALIILSYKAASYYLQASDDVIAVTLLSANQTNTSKLSSKPTSIR